MGYIESMLLKDETILYTGRKHATLLFGRVIGVILLLILLGAGVLGANTLLFRKDDPNEQLMYAVYGILAIAGVVLLVRATLDYLRWRNDCVVLTNRRIMKFEGLFNRSMIDSSLDKINDVALTQTLMGRLLGYGDIKILTAAETGIQEMRHLADPIGFKRALAEARSYDAKALSHAAVAAVENAVDSVVNDNRDAH